MKKTWRPPIDEDEFYQFMGVAKHVLECGCSKSCPSCKQVDLRFYCHRFDAKSNRGTIWLWCPKCSKHIHVSRMILDFSFVDPFEVVKGKQFQLMEQEGWFDRLDLLWEEASIPREIDVGKT